jgi:hypothetical protein
MCEFLLLSAEELRADGEPWFSEEPCFNDWLWFDEEFEAF